MKQSFREEAQMIWKASQVMRTRATMDLATRKITEHSRQTRSTRRPGDACVFQTEWHTVFKEQKQCKGFWTMDAFLGREI